MPKILIYDFDRGLKSIGSDERIASVFGYSPRRFIRCSSADDLFQKTHKAQVLTVQDDLGDVEEEYYVATKDIDFEVLDSITAWAALKKKEVKGAAQRISLPQWGEIGESTEDLILKLTRTNTNVIVIGHTKAEKDEDLGIIRYIPAISGRMSNEIARHFDLVMYSIVTQDDKGFRSYQWQIAKDERRSAKCRIEEVSKYAEKNGGCLPQDYELLFSLMKDHKAVKILVLGDSGSGKTYSLKTLKNVIVNAPAKEVKTKS